MKDLRCFDDEQFEDGAIVELVGSDNILQAPEGTAVVAIDASGGSEIAEGTVGAPRTTLHGCSVAPDEIVLLITALRVPDSLGDDPYGEPIGVGSYAKFRCSDIRRK